MEAKSLLEAIDPRRRIRSNAECQLLSCLMQICFIREEQERLASAYCKYRSNMDILDYYTNKTERLVSLVGHISVPDVHVAAVQGDLLQEVAVTLKEFMDHPAKTSIWDRCEACLEIVDVATVGEIVSLLELFGITVTRAAVESALKTHKSNVTLQTGRPRRYALNRKPA